MAAPASSAAVGPPDGRQIQASRRQRECGQRRPPRRPEPLRRPSQQAAGAGSMPPRCRGCRPAATAPAPVAAPTLGHRSARCHPARGRPRRRPPGRASRAELRRCRHGEGHDRPRPGTPPRPRLRHVLSSPLPSPAPAMPKPKHQLRRRRPTTLLPPARPATPFELPPSSDGWVRARRRRKQRRARRPRPAVRLWPGAPAPPGSGRRGARARRSVPPSSAGGR